MRSQTTFMVLGFFSLIAAPGTAEESSAPTLQTNIECAVTTPNGIAAGEDHPDTSSYGNAQVSVGPFGLWPDGTVVLSQAAQALSRAMARSA
jgi:hypothetical protein